MRVELGRFFLGQVCSGSLQSKLQLHTSGNPQSPIYPLQFRVLFTFQACCFVVSGATLKLLKPF